MRTTEFESNHKINNCVRNAWRAIEHCRAVDNIFYAYNHPSVYKLRAWDWVKAACRDDEGYRVCITGWNSSKFTAAYFCSHHETNALCLVVHTADNVYWCFVSELEKI